MLRFQDFELDRGAYELRRGGQVVHLERIPLDLLFLLAEKPGQLVTREEILERVWGKGVFLDGDARINAAVRKIRRALGDDADAPRFIVTLPAKGYRFIADVREEPSPQRTHVCPQLVNSNTSGSSPQRAVWRGDGLSAVPKVSPRCALLLTLLSAGKRRW